MTSTVDAICLRLSQNPSKLPSPQEALVNIIRSFANGTQGCPTIMFERCAHHLSNHAATEGLAVSMIASYDPSTPKAELDRLPMQSVQRDLRVHGRQCAYQPDPLPCCDSE